jgi:hypothetical protein
MKFFVWLQETMKHIEKEIALRPQSADVLWTYTKISPPGLKCLGVQLSKSGDIAGMMG